MSNLFGLVLALFRLLVISLVSCVALSVWLWLANGLFDFEVSISRELHPSFYVNWYDLRSDIQEQPLSFIVLGAFFFVAFPYMAVFIARIATAPICQLERNNAARSFLSSARKGRSPSQWAVTLLRSFLFDDAFGDSALEKKADRFGRPSPLIATIGALTLDRSTLAALIVDHEAKSRRFEAKLRKAVEALRPTPVTCSIGNEDASFAFGRIRSTTANWQDRALLLSRHSTVLLMMFAPSAGTSWELANILDDDSILRKTIFICPPANALTGETDVKVYEIERYYSRLITELKARNLEPPTLRHDMAFYFDAERRVHQIDLWSDRTEISDLTSLIREMLSGMRVSERGPSFA